MATENLLKTVAVICCVIALISVRSTWGTSHNMARHTEAMANLYNSMTAASGYDRHVRPWVNETGPTIAYLNMYVRNIEKICDRDMEFTTQITMRYMWTDPRLKFDAHSAGLNYLTLTDIHEIWMPDLFFKNSKKSYFHTMMTPNQYLRIFPDGNVLYSTRITMTLTCPMNLKLFPFDRQICSIYMASYSLTTDDLVFIWKDIDPVQVSKYLHLPFYTLIKFRTDYCNSRTNTGSYSCLRIDFEFAREFSNYLLRYYIPAVMLVILSWTVFWVSPSNITGRATVGLLLILGYTFKLQMSEENFAAVVSYTKAIDVWTGVTMTFLFIAFMESMISNYYSRVRSNKTKVEGEEVDASGLATKPTDERNSTSATEHGKKTMIKSKLRQWYAAFAAGGNIIDVVSRILIPILYAMFVGFYYTIYSPVEDEHFAASGGQVYHVRGY